MLWKENIFMSGIFGIISDKAVSEKDLQVLAMHSRQRGSDTSGLVYNNRNGYKITRTDYDIKKLLRIERWSGANVVMGNSSLINNKVFGNQTVVFDGLCLLSNGLIVNDEEVLNLLGLRKSALNNSEIIIRVATKYIDDGGGIEELAERILAICQGTISAVLTMPRLGKALLFSNNGSLYMGKKNGSTCFSTERYPLSAVECVDIIQIWEDGMIVDIPKAEKVEIDDNNKRVKDKPTINFKNIVAEEAMLQYPKPNIKRCTKCILPETMPFISFDIDGVCNYCRNYKTRNTPKPKGELFELVKPYRRENGADCIVPFSGGRDSSYGLHLIVKELEMTPITYTYDWGMVTDLGHRNISRMCSNLGVENITIAADITKKRQNITKNLKAWLKSPHLGMISILTAGDKHFFQYIDTIKEQTGVDLNLWGINPLEVTYFKSGFLGIRPDFEEKSFYTNGLYNQLRYQLLRFKAMSRSPGYLNSSLWDTLSGEYYRSFAKKNDYFHVFDYWCWDEKIINETLSEYDWELAPDTNTTWRIGDGTAAFYNYIYYTVAGFTEHDTFRSNQIREGQITRDEALKLVEDENKPRYQNICWYLDILNMDFIEVIGVINSIPKLYSQD